MLVKIRMYQCIAPLEINLDRRLDFNEHLDGIIKKTSRKINALINNKLTVYAKESCILHLANLGYPLKSLGKRSHCLNKCQSANACNGTA